MAAVAVHHRSHIVSNAHAEDRALFDQMDRPSSVPRIYVPISYRRTRADGLRQATTTVLREAGQEHAGVTAVLSKTVAEFLGEEGFLAAGLGVKGKPGDGHGQQSACFTHGDRAA
jgi:hypothetical protein